MPRVDRLSGGRLLRPNRDHVRGVLLGQQADVRRARELETYRFLAVVAQAVTHAGCEALVGDADVLADPETGNARERARRRLENEAHRARLALRRQLVVARLQHDRLRLSYTQPVLDKCAAPDFLIVTPRELAR